MIEETYGQYSIYMPAVVAHTAQDTTCPTAGNCRSCINYDGGLDDRTLDALAKGTCESNCDTLFSLRSRTPYRETCSIAQEIQDKYWEFHIHHLIVFVVKQLIVMVIIHPKITDVTN